MSSRLTMLLHYFHSSVTCSPPNTCRSPQHKPLVPNPVICKYVLSFNQGHLNFFSFFITKFGFNIHLLVLLFKRSLIILYYIQIMFIIQHSRQLQIAMYIKRFKCMNTSVNNGSGVTLTCILLLLQICIAYKYSMYTLHTLLSFILSCTT